MRVKTGTKCYQFVWNAPITNTGLKSWALLATGKIQISCWPSKGIGWEQEHQTLACSIGVHEDWKPRYRAQIIRRKQNLTIFINSTSMERWYSNGLWKGAFAEAIPRHLSDALRMALLFRFGGSYLDTDVISLKSIEHLPKNTIGKKRESKLPTSLNSDRQRSKVRRPFFWSLDLCTLFFKCFFRCHRIAQKTQTFKIFFTIHNFWRKVWKTVSTQNVWGRISLLHYTKTDTIFP